jgi:hypothetical protein
LPDGLRRQSGTLRDQPACIGPEELLAGPVFIISATQVVIGHQAATDGSFRRPSRSLKPALLASASEWLHCKLWL